MQKEQKDLLNRAIVFAVEKHAGAVRKGTVIPYIVHPLEALAIASSMTDRQEVLVAAVLHDVVEDAGVSRSELVDRFGERVAELVMAESEDKCEGESKSASWRKRKEETIVHLRGISDIDVKMIALSDKLSNMRSIYRDYTTIGEDFWNRFNQKDKSQHGWYYSEMADVLSELSDTFAWKEYSQLVGIVFEEVTP